MGHPQGGINCAQDCGLIRHNGVRYIQDLSPYSYASLVQLLGTTSIWGNAHKVTLDFSRPGKPTDNAYIEALTVGLDKSV